LITHYAEETYGIRLNILIPYKL